MKSLNEKEYIDNPKDYKANDPKVLNKLNDPETGLKAQQSAQNDAIATRMAKDVASSFGKSPPKSIPYMPPYKRINQQSISGPVTKANEENTMSLIHDKKTLSVADAVSKIMEAEKMAKKDHDQDGKIENGKDEYLGSRIRAAKMSGKLKEEEQIDEAFPTVADGEKNLRAKEGKTSMGTVTKTKTGLVHSRDYEHNAEDDDHPAKRGRPMGGGAGKSTKKKKLTEMIAAYKERGIDSLYEEPDNETFTKELKDQKAKFDGKKKGGDVAKPSVQAVKVEQYEEDDGPLSEEQLDELSKGTLGSYIKAASHDVATKGALTRHFADKSRREKEEKKGWEADKSMKKADKTFAAGWKRRQNMAKAVDRLTKEEVQLDERTLTADETSKKEDYVKGMKKSVSGFKERYGDKAK
jgi:hypothetical protein